MLVGHWSSADIATQEQFGFVRDLLLNTPVPIRVERPGIETAQGFHSASWYHTHGEGVAAVRSIGEAAAGFRGSAEIARGAPECTWVLQYRRTSGEMTLDGTPFAVNPGDILYGDCGVRQIGMGADHVDFTMWMLPSAWLAPLLARPEGDPRGVLRRSTALGRLASDYLAGLGAALDAAPPEAATMLIGNFVSLLALDRGLSPHHDEPARDVVADTRLHALRRAIVTGYTDPSLSPATLAGRQGLSLRTLHLLFEPGGVSCARFILETRLEAARVLLADVAQDGRTIADIAFCCGFESLSTFYRTFRARFGIAPAAVREERWDG